MRRPLLIARHAAHPSGVLGRFLAAIMRRETAALNRAVLSHLDPMPGDCVLEVGFGAGLLIDELLQLPVGRVVGVDHSMDLVEALKARQRAAVSDGRLSVVRSLDEVMHLGATAAVCVHTVYFWRDAIPPLAQLRSRLRSGGRLLLAARTDEATWSDLPPEVYTMRSRAELLALLEAAGFERITVKDQVGATTIFRAHAPEHPVSTT